MTDLDRALAILDEMIENATRASLHPALDEHARLVAAAQMVVLDRARDRLAALATTTPDTIPREGEA